MKNKILWANNLLMGLIIAFSFINYQSEEKLKQTPQNKVHQESEQTIEKKYNYEYFSTNTKTPNFKSIQNTKERKEVFFHYISPFVDEKNYFIMKDRERLLLLLSNEKEISTQDKEWVYNLQKHYKIKANDRTPEDNLRTLLNHIDIIPASLTLAQAANESAWGTSRFAMEGNNFFGQWCFQKGCGLVPKSRNSQADHEVRKFKNVKESIFSYIDNLNTNNAYKALRDSRATLRNNKETITGLDLTNGLTLYSERGTAYVKEIEELIRYNKLWRFNHH